MQSTTWWLSFDRAVGIGATEIHINVRAIGINCAESYCTVRHGV
ncbi:hypothetical protein [Paraburkholderia sp. GAS334]